MSDTKQIIDSLLEEYFGDLHKEIQKKSAIVSQDFTSRGLYGSTACTNHLLGVYYNEFENRVEDLISFIDKKALLLDWGYLETKLHELAAQVCKEAKSTASVHLANAGLANLITSFHPSVEKRKSEIFGTVRNKIQLINMLHASTSKPAVVGDTCNLGFLSVNWRHLLSKLRQMKGWKRIAAFILAILCIILIGGFLTRSFWIPYLSWSSVDDASKNETSPAIITTGPNSPVTLNYSLPGFTDKDRNDLKSIKGFNRDAPYFMRTKWYQY